MKLVITTAAILLSGFLVHTRSSAQVSVIATEEKPFIEVYGTAEKEVIPDRIHIRIVIREKYEGKNKIGIEAQEKKMKDAFTSIGVDLNRLSLADADADYVKIRWKTNDVLTQKEYNLEVSSAAILAKVFMELEKLEIKDARITHVEHSAIEELRKEVKIMAIKAAKDKADYLLAAIGSKTGKPQVIREENYTMYDEYLLSNTKVKEGYFDFDKNTGGNPGDDEISFQKIRIKSSIYAKFLME